MESKYQ